MDYTSQMTALLSELRRERNGEAADSMRFYGNGCGLNLGVAIHTIRSIAGQFPHDHEFAVYLYRQDVRELRIAALWLAEPHRVMPDSFSFWESGIINSEIAEQAAMALFKGVECADELIERWSRSDNALVAYAALLTAARNERCCAESAIAAAEAIVARFEDNRLVGQGAVAALSALYMRSADAVRQSAERISKNITPTARFVSEELSWRLAVD